MTQVIFVQPDGSQQAVEAREGYSLMEVARMAGIPGIIAECGGGAICGTCHVKIASGHALPPASPVEADVLEFEDQYEEGVSRLSCQILVTPALDGLILRVATG